MAQSTLDGAWVQFIFFALLEVPVVYAAYQWDRRAKRWVVYLDTSSGRAAAYETANRSEAQRLADAVSDAIKMRG